jgi:hypothetical protein
VLASFPFRHPQRPTTTSAYSDTIFRKHGLTLLSPPSTGLGAKRIRSELVADANLKSIRLDLSFLGSVLDESSPLVLAFDLDSSPLRWRVSVKAFVWPYGVVIDLETIERPSSRVMKSTTIS